MNKTGMGSLSDRLPVKHSLMPFFALTGLIALLMTGASIAGWLYPGRIYPTDELRLSFVPTDVVNLVIGLPILLGSLWLAKREQLVGLLFLPGALLYILYNYINYLFAVPFNALFLVYLMLVVLSIYTLAGLVMMIDGERLRDQLENSVPEKIGGGVLAGLALLFFLRVIGVVFLALIRHEVLSQVELVLLSADFILAPAQLIGGILLWRRKTLGYVSALGLLFQMSMLFVGLIFLLILQPLILSVSLNVMDILVVFVMGMVCFIPLGMFLKGILSERGTLPSRPAG